MSCTLQMQIWRVSLAEETADGSTWGSLCGGLALQIYRGSSGMQVMARSLSMTSLKNTTSLHSVKVVGLLCDTLPLGSLMLHRTEAVL